MKYFDDIIYGTQYYRAPTPLESEWEPDIIKMGELGIEAMQIRVQWRQNERGEDNYYFDDVDKLFDLAEKHNKKVVFKFLLETAPQYIYDKYDGTRMNPDGTPIVPTSHGAFYVGGWLPCFDNEMVIERAKKFVRVFAERYYKRSSLILWNVWNEARSRPVGDCACKHCQKRWREYLKEQYQTIENFNAFFGLAEADFESIPYSGVPHGYWDFYTYRKWRAGEALHDKLKFVYDEIRKVDKERPIMSHVGFAAIFQNGFDDNSDDYTVSKAVDFYGTSCFITSAFHTEEQIKIYTPMLCDYLRGIDENFFVHEVYADWGAWYDAEKPEALKYMLWSIISHGAKGLMYWQMRAERLGLENNLAGFVNMDGTDKPITKVVGEVGKILADNKELFAASAPKKADVVFVYDFDSMLMSAVEDHGDELFVAEKHPNAVNYYNTAVHGMYKLMMEEGYRVDFIDSRDIEKIAEYKVAYVPYGAMLDRQAEQTLKSFAENGGTLLLDEGFGLRQKNTWLTNRVLFTDLIDARWHNRVRDFKHRNETFTVEGERVTIKPYRTDYEVGNADVLATFDDGMPAIVSVTAGKGKIVLFGTSIGYSYGEFGEKGWKKLVGHFLGDAHRMENYGKEIITTINETPDGELHYLFNTGKADAYIDCTFDRIIFGAALSDNGKLLVKAGDVACVYIQK
ncbi:MAG: hypothetical protein E7403_06270 [Ruminococcaceae bacterium]|nr:hypothetical protein [Oscillospiraceae bacterium]